MNIFKFFNRAATAPAQAAAPNASLSPNLNAQPAPLPPAKGAKPLDQWEAKYCIEPYFPAGRIMPGNGFYFNGPTPPITGKLIKAVFDRAGGPALFGSNLAAIKEFKALQDNIAAQLNELSFFNVGQIFREQKDKAVPQLLKGERPTFQGYDATRDTVSAARQALHNANRELAKKIFDHIAPACETFRDTARKMADELDAKERADHAKHYGDETAFSPSPLLRALAFIALRIWEVPVRNFKLCGLCTAPDPDNLVQMWWNQPEHKPVLPFRPQLERRDLAGEARENDAADRARKREELNKLLETIKAKAAQTIEDRKNHLAARAVDMELRKGAVMEKLSTETGGQNAQ